ncbi:MAG TPA: hypothetical protein VLR46_01345 [Candidatus Dormibacteraeota bacterium]|nr:hypothetical protein [Candidatus Dormibacteraeota bacterium]
MTEERRQILEMLATGKINADEADRLLGAMQGGQQTNSAISQKPAPKYLRVVVDANEKDEGPVHINVRVPIMLLRAGVRLASLVPVSAQTRLNEELRKNGLDFDISQIKPENLNEVIDHLSDVTVDIDHQHDGVKVKFFAE